MRYKQLGKSELRVSEIGIGCMSFKQEYESEALYMMDYAFDQGVNFVDTADLYERGYNEELLGKAIKGRRDQVIVATKVGNVWNGDGWDWNPTKPYILSAVKDSLKRLKLDYIDLYQLHGGTLDDPIDETIEAFEQLKAEGLIRYYGISSIRPNVIRTYVHKSNISSLMSQYSILDRRPEEETFDLARIHQIGVIVRGPVAQGLLSSKWREKIKPIGYLDYTADELQHILEQLEHLVPTGYSFIQLAIQYVLSHPSVTTIVPGASQLEQLKEILATKDLPALDQEVIHSIKSLTKINTYQQYR